MSRFLQRRERHVVPLGMRGLILRKRDQSRPLPYGSDVDRFIRKQVACELEL